MKKIILIIIIIVIATSSVCLIIGIFRKLHDKNLLDERIKRLPKFSLTTPDKMAFSSSEIREGPLLIIYFHPECEHCQNEISELFKSRIFESGITLMLVSDAALDSVICFLNRYSVPENARLITLIDTAFVFSNVFGNPAVPSSYLYNKELSLICSYTGEYKIETILNRFSGSE